MVLYIVVDKIFFVVSINSVITRHCLSIKFLPCHTWSLFSQLAWFRKILLPTPSPLEASTWFKLLRVKLYRNDPKGNKNYFELAGGSSYRWFKLLRVKLQ